MKECDILGGSNHTLDSYIFSGVRTPATPGSTPLVWSTRIKYIDSC